MYPYAYIASAGCLALCVAGAVSAQTLPEVVRTVVEGNPEARVAEATLRATGEELNQARAGYYPSIEVRGDAGYESLETPGLRAAGAGSRTLIRQQGSLVMRQTLFDGGQVSSEVARQSSRVDAARSRVAETRDSLTLRISEVYLDLLQVDALLGLARDNVVTHRDTATKTRRRFELGVGGRGDVEQAEGRLAVAQATVVNREAALNDARARYERVVGMPPGPLSLPSAPELPVERQQVLDRAAARNPAVHTAIAELAAARAAVEGARAPFYPKVELEINANRGRDVDGVRGFTNQSTALLVLRQNLFRGGGDLARKRELAERQIAAEESLANARRVVQEEASRAWVALNASRDALTFLERHVGASAAALKAYRSQFELGRRSLLDLLNAENELFQAQSTWTTSQHDVLRHQYRTLTSMSALAEYFGVAPEPVPPAP